MKFEFEVLPKTHISLGLYYGPYVAEDLATGEITQGYSLELSFLFFNIHFYF